MRSNFIYCCIATVFFLAILFIIFIQFKENMEQNDPILLKCVNKLKPILKKIV